MEIKELGEFGFIKKLACQFATRHSKIVKGIGDDASVTIQDANRYLLCSTDTLVEDIHFSLNYTPADKLGKKAVSISASDIAAMGGKPLFLLTSINVPNSTSVKFINLLYKGIKEKCDELNIALIGGNTSSSDKIIINTTILGEVPKDQVIFRKGASEGDMIFVTGYLGDSSLGLKLLNRKKRKKITERSFGYAMNRHIDPSPRVIEGRAIAKKKLASSMIDISDGLIADLRHIAEESSVGARIWVNKIPLSICFKKWISKYPNDINLAIAGGEDYELLFTAPKSNITKIDIISRKLGIPITHIGEIMPKKCGITVVGENGKIFNHAVDGFEHFKNKN